MTDKDDLPAWLQAKITDTEHNTDAAAGYMDEEVITEKRDGKSSKDKGYSLRDWFRGGGWKQTGGKYDGKPCAKQPGQKTKPYCRDADDRAAMSKKERNKRAAKKRREDPNPNKKGKAKNVRQESYSNWRTELDEGLLGGLGLAAGAYAAYKAGKYLHRKGHEALDNARQNATLRGKPFGAGARQRAIEDGAGVKRGTLDPNMQRLRNSYEPEGDTVSEGEYKYGSYSTGRYRMLDGTLKTPADIDAHIKSKQSGKKPPVQTDKAHYEPQGELVDEGKKDACYHKVKSRYSVWPSAYASGALVKCRKVGAKNWGNKSKKKNESYDLSNWRDDFQATEYESVDIIKAEPLQPTQGLGSEMLEAKSKKDRLKEISAQLKKASAMHAKQSKAVAKCADELTEAPIVEPAATKRPSMMQQAQDIRAMRMRSLQRQGKPLEVEKIRSTLPTAAVDASNQRARELDKIRRQSRDATIARANTSTPRMSGTVASTPAPAQQAQSIPAPKPDVVPPVNQAQKDAAAKLDDATLKRYNMDPKVVKPEVVKPQPKVTPQPEPKNPIPRGLGLGARPGEPVIGTPAVNPIPRGLGLGARPGQPVIGTPAVTPSTPKPIPLKVEPFKSNKGDQSSSQQADQIRQSAMNDVNKAYEKDERRTFYAAGYKQNPVANKDGSFPYLSPKQIRDMEREIRMNKNYDPSGLRKYYNSATGKLELPNIEIPEEVQLDEKCWKGYEKKGMKTMFGKRYPNCVKKKKTRKEEVEHIDEKINPLLKGILKKTPKGEDPKKGGVPYKITGRMTTADHYQPEGEMLEAKNGGDNDPCWDTHKQVGMKKKGNRMVPNCVPKEQVSDWRSELDLQEKKKKNCGCGKDPCETYGKQEDVKEDWQKANRKDKTDGMSQKAVNAYKRENPGSKLKTAVTGKVKKGSKDAKRRKSFCSRSNGQRKMHNIDCSKTPDKKICKARRRWKC